MVSRAGMRGAFTRFIKRGMGCAPFRPVFWSCQGNRSAAQDIEGIFGFSAVLIKMETGGLFVRNPA
jgi:hypothetical protein